MEDKKTAMDMVIQNSHTKESDPPLATTEPGQFPTNLSYVDANGMVKKYSPNEHMNVQPVEVVNVDVEARKWLVKNRNTLEKMVNEYLANEMVDDICKPDLLESGTNQIFAIELKRNSRYKDTTDSIIVISNDKSNIERIGSFVTGLSEESKDDLCSIQYLFPQRASAPISYATHGALYEYTTTVSVTENYTYSKDDNVISYEDYLNAIGIDMDRIGYYKSMLSFFERRALKRELRAISTLFLWYEIAFCEDH